MKEAMRKIGNSGRLTAIRIRNRLERFKEDINGLGTVEVVLLVAVLVALALLFKTFITRYANNIFDNIEEKTGEVFEDW